MSGTLGRSIFSGSVADTSKTLVWGSDCPSYPPFKVQVTCAVSCRVNGVRAVESAGGLFYAEVDTAAAIQVIVVSDSGNLGQTDIVGIY